VKARRGTGERSAGWVGVDVGGTNVRAGCVDNGGQLIGWVSYPHQMAAGDFGCIEEAANKALERAGTTWAAVCGLGVAVAGIVDPSSGVVLDSANLGWRGLPLQAELQRRLGVLVTIENDVCASALAELAVQPGGGACPWLFVSVGTGIGACLVLDRVHGQLLCLDVGHVPFGGDVTLGEGRKRCRCGQYGCLETAASGAAFTAAAKAFISNDATHGLRSRAATITGKDVLDSAMCGDRICIEVLASAGRACGQAVANLVNLLTPAAVGLAGGMMCAGSPYLEGLLEVAQREAKPWLRDICTFATARCGEEAGVIGATELAKRRMKGFKAVSVGPS
jgi:glucokinase